MTKTVFTYQIDLEEPVLLTGLEGDPNSSVSYDFIPGSVLRGVFIGRHKRIKSAIEDAANNDSQRLFFSETKTQFLNGNITFGRLYDDEKLIAYPAPASWRKPKYPEKLRLDTHRCGADDSENNKETIYDFAVQHQDEVPKPVGTWWVGDEQDIALAFPTRRIAVHTARNRQYGRAKGAQAGQLEDGEIRGAVFRYESLAAGQTFHAQIICTEESKEDVGAWFSQPFVSHIGGARSAGYGRVRITLIDQQSQNIPDTSPKNSTLTITLLSDLLVRDQYTGQWSVALESVAHLLGVDEKLLQRDKCFINVRHIGGFNRKWGLPLPQKIAFQAGSVFVFNVDTPPSTSDTERWLMEGIGWHRNEGFGRIALNQHRSSKINVIQPLSSQEPQPVTLPDDQKVIAKQLLKNLLASELEQHIVERAKAIDTTAKPNKMKSTQFGRLRLVVQKAIRDGDVEALKAFIKKAKDRAVAKKQYESATVEGGNLFQWLEGMIEHAEFDGQDMLLKRIPAIGTVSLNNSDVPVQRVKLQIVDAVLKRIQKKAKRKEAKQDE